MNDESWSDIRDDEIKLNKEIINKSSLINTLSLDTPTASSSTETLSNIEIMNIDYTKISDVKLLEYQSFIANKLKQYVSCTEIDIESKSNMLNELKWLSKSSNYLAKKYNQKELSHSRKHYSNIPRNSYKFCNFGYTCKYNSNKQKCYGQHFVFNLIKSDIDEVIYYLESIGDINMKEICISLNTISFVFNHMYDEMNKIIIDKNKSLVSQKIKHV
jgi:hypothetical protein